MKNILIISVFFIILSCASNVSPADDIPADEETVSAEMSPVQDIPADTEEPPGSENNDEFSVSEEKYQLTLSYINNLIDDINKAISEKDFDTWKTYLSDSYIDAYDSPEDLQPYSDMFKQKGYETRLVNLKDFFDYVVVASRKNLEISHLEFLDETHLKVMTIYKQETAVLYYMELINDDWKITVW